MNVFTRFYFPIQDANEAQVPKKGEVTALQGMNMA